jgi:hypothetical protein
MARPRYVRSPRPPAYQSQRWSSRSAPSRGCSKAAIDVAIAGDDEPVPVLQPGWTAKAQATTTVEDFLAVVGEVVVNTAKQAAGLVVFSSGRV